MTRAGETRREKHEKTLPNCFGKKRPAKVSERNALETLTCQLQKRSHDYRKTRAGETRREKREKKIPKS